MPIRKVGTKYQWGEHGALYATREEAGRQAAAAHANGYVGDAKIKGAGICLIAPDGEMLFLKRSPSSNHPGEWDFAGGKADDNETPEQTARRETREEIGGVPHGELMPMDHEPDADGVEFVTYKMHVHHKFTPKLQLEEHTAFVWAKPENAPQPLHPGIAATFKKIANDAVPLSVAASRLGHVGGMSTSPVKIAASRANGKKHAQDCIAMDSESVRTTDADGRLHVSISNISKATINPYLGKEIPNGVELLGLNPDEVYMLLRDPEELEKAATTFNNLPLLSEHVPVSAEAHKPELVIGSTGTDAVFEAPYLKNSIVIWAKDAIDGILSKDVQEISCAYRYDVDMTPGEYEDKKYHGVMRNLIGNHVAIVPTGRAGKDVVVGDSAVPSSNTNLHLEKSTMSTTLSKKARTVRGVLLAVLKPQIAADAMPDFETLLAGVKKSNWLEKKPGIAAACQAKLASDANVEALVELLDSLDDVGSNDKDMGLDADPVDAILEHCRGKLTDEELSELETKVRALSPAKIAGDEPPEFKDKPEVGKGPKTAEDEKEEKDEKDMVSKPAMDAAIKAASKAAEEATIKRINGIHDARKTVAPYVGELAIACDSADDVYRAALKTLGIKVDGVHPSAFRAILEAQPNPNAARKAPAMAQDSKGDAAYSDFLKNVGLGA